MCFICKFNIKLSNTSGILNINKWQFREAINNPKNPLVHWTPKDLWSKPTHLLNRSAVVQKTASRLQLSSTAVQKCAEYEMDDQRTDRTNNWPKSP